MIAAAWDVQFHAVAIGRMGTSARPTNESSDGQKCPSYDLFKTLMLIRADYFL